MCLNLRAKLLLSRKFNVFSILMRLGTLALPSTHVLNSFQLRDTLKSNKEELARKSNLQHPVYCELVAPHPYLHSKPIVDCGFGLVRMDFRANSCFFGTGSISSVILSEAKNLSGFETLRCAQGDKLTHYHFFTSVSL